MTFVPMKMPLLEIYQKKYPYCVGLLEVIKLRSY